MLQKEYKPKIKLQIGENYKFVKDIVKDQNLNTIEIQSSGDFFL